jgi:hypothetical protein
MRNNEGRTQIPPELLEQFMKQQEEKIVGASIPSPAPKPAGYQVPTDFVELPSGGKFYPTNHPWYGKDKIEVSFMTTREEDILSSQQYAEAGVMFDKLLESICVDRVDPRTILLGDREAILINARKNAYGDEYSFSANCQNCFLEYESSIFLSSLQAKELEVNSVSEQGTVSVELPVSKSVVEFKMATVGDIKQIENQKSIKEKHGLHFSPTVELHRTMIVSIDGHTDTGYITPFVNQMLLKDSRFLRKKYEENKPELDFSFVHKCGNCGHENKGGVPVGISFFWSDS